MKNKLQSGDLIRRYRNRHNSDEGFTLIELLIVVVVLGILAAIVVFALGNQTSEAAKAACKADAKSVEVAVEVFRAKTGAYPGSVAALVPTYLRQAPGVTKYIITTAAGAVLVDPTPLVAGGETSFDLSPNPCDAVT